MRGSRLIAPIAFAFAFATAAGRAHAQDAAGEPSPEAKQRALTLFEAGRTHYDLGEYDQAVAKFKEAYGVSSAPLLLFNIAQAYRMKGDCPRALEAYRHFVRRDPTSPQRPDADAQVAALGAQCGRPPPATPPVPAEAGATGLRAQAPARSERPPGQTGSRGQRLALALLGTGIGVGLGAVGVGLWNHARYERWTNENSRLSRGDANVPAAQWVSEQDDNDELIDSIHRMDKVWMGMGIAAVTCLLGAAAAPYLLPGEPAVRASDKEIGLAWTVRWK